MAQWQLFLDERGQFSQEQTAWLAGLAVQGAATREHDAKLKLALEAAYPGVPWPMHASQLNMPISHALYRLAGVSAPPEVRSLCAPAVTAITTSRAPVAQEFVAAARAVADSGGRGGRIELTYDLTCRAQTWLEKEHHHAARGLAQLQALQDRSMRDLLGTVARGSHGVSAFAVVVECDPFDSTELGAARWRNAFQLVLGRATDLMRGPKGNRDQVFIQSAAYDGVRGRDLGTLSSALTTKPWFHASGECTLFPARPQRFGQAAAAGVVVADYLANRLHRSLHGDLQAVASRVPRDLGLPIVCVPKALADSPPLPACLATGAPAQALDRKDEPRAVELVSGARTWQHEQALAWLRAPRGGGA